jgi:hypothetical protein
MGRRYLWSDAREESWRFVDHELYRHDFLHLHPLPLPEIGRTSISHGNVSKRRFRGSCYHLHIRHALLATASEQDNEEK